MRVLIDGQTFETPEIHRGIGVYIKNTINQMVKISYAHDWYIVVSNPRNLKELDPWVMRRLHIIVAKEAKPGSDYSKNGAYTEKLQEIVRKNDIDTVWIPNALMVNVLFLSNPLSCPVFVTVYDLIPCIFPVKEWARAIREEYQRRLMMLKECRNIRLFMISEATHQDWIHYMDDPESECTVTFLSADSKLFYKKRFKDNSMKQEPYILFTGGFDYRKNIDGAISAFANAREAHQEDAEFLQYKFVIVGKYDAATKQKYDDFIASKGLTDQIFLTGYISDEELADLYQGADLFFFPSLYEGFGLPVLEAMLGGAYIISADNSSLPEVCNGFATLFSVDNSKQMSEALYKGFCEYKKESQEDIDRRQEYALSISWDHTAAATLEMMERSVMTDPDGRKRPALAIFTPWADQKTGIANYENKLIPYLEKYFDITVFTTAEAKKDPDQSVKAYPVSSFVSMKDRYDYKLYQIGNNASFHKEIFEMLEKEGGIAEVHDYILTPFFYSVYGKNPDTFEKLLVVGYGEEKGRKFSKRTKEIRNHPNINECPMSDTVAALSEKTIFHNHWSCEKMNRKGTYTIPLLSFPLDVPDDETLNKCRTKFKKAFRIKDGELLLGCFGWVNNNKRPKVLMKAVQLLKEKGYPVKLIFWGKNDLADLPGLIKKEGLSDTVFISDYLTAEEYYTGLEMTDIVVNLRYPSMGEASGTLCEAFQMGKPAIVSDVNQYREYPDEVCWKLPVCSKEAELLAGYISYLRDHPDVKQAMGNNAKAYAEYALDPERIARLYYYYITQEECS